jgi:hypothetical protein
VDRRSHDSDRGYDVTEGGEGRPLNPRGRTGLAGRGVLGRWGPNQAADPIVTRWQRDAATGEIVRAEGSEGRAILEFVSIERKDNGGWAIPGKSVPVHPQFLLIVRGADDNEKRDILKFLSMESKDNRCWAIPGTSTVFFFLFGILEFVSIERRDNSRYTGRSTIFCFLLICAGKERAVAAWTS